MFVPGFGICSGIVPLPHARQRLTLDDPARVRVFARRFGPDLCATLDDHCQIAWDGDRWTGNAQARQLTSDGSLQQVGAA